MTSDNTAMRCLLEEMRDNPGSIGYGAAAGAAQWALERIAYLEEVIRDLSWEPEIYLVSRKANQEGNP